MRYRYALVAYNFNVTDDCSELCKGDAPCDFVKLLTGDRVCIYAEKEGWCYGSVIGGDTGLFPLSVVNLVAKDSASTEGSNLVDEIRKVTQQWWLRIKDIYGKHSEMHYLEEVLDYIDDMLAVKKKILSGDVPSEELNVIRMQITRKVDRGNLLLSLGVVIRQSNGVAYDPESISILQTYQEHLIAEKSISSDLCTTAPKFDIFSVMLSVQSMELRMKYNCEISMSLYDVEQRQFTSETFSFIWKLDTPSARDLNIRCLFSNFTRDDFGRHFILVTRVAHIAPIESTSSTLKRSQESGPSNLFCRQVYAFDFLDLSYVFDNPQPSNDAKEKLLFLNRDQEFDHAFKSLQVTGRIPKFNTSSDDIKLLIATQVLAGSVCDIKRNSPYLFTRSPPAVLHRTVPPFSMIVGETRNDLYVCLQSGELLGKSSDRNIEARLNVVENNGGILPDCFETIGPCGSKLTSDYRSFLFYHQDKPFWMEQIKIRLPDSAVHDLHIRISLHARKPYDKSKPEKVPFALAHIRLLLNTALLADDDHELLVYKIESSHYDNNNTTYLSLPQTRKQLRELGSNNKPHSAAFSLSEKSSLHLSTRACSTLLTQNDHVLNLLRWRTNSFNLNSALSALASPVGDTELDMMRFLCPLLDALYDIWEDRDQLELPVFDVIVSIFKLVEEPRNVLYADVLQKYMERFSFSTASIKLLRCLNHYIASAATNNNDKTRNSLKVMGRVFNTVVSSMESAKRFGDTTYSSALFRGHLEGVLESLLGLMSESRERMAIQNTALKHLPSVVDPVLRSRSYEPAELSHFLVRVMNGFGKNIVARERLGFVAQLIDTQLFEQSASRSVLLPRCLDLLLIHLDGDSCEEKEFPDRAAECASIVAALIERLFPATIPPGSTMAFGTEDELNLIISSTYRPVVQAMISIINVPGVVESVRARFFTLILALLNKMSAQIFDQYLKSRPTIVDKMDFVLEMVQMIRDLLSKCPFSATWHHMVMLQNKTVHKALRFIMSAIQTYFSNESFYSEVWEEYIVTMVCFVSQPSLQSSDEWMRDDADPRFVLRKAAAKDLRSMWFRLTPIQKMEYIPRLVGSFLEVAMVEDDETREATIPIFFDMMQCEFHSCIDNTPQHRNFKLFSDELIAQLDKLVDENYGTRSFQEQFTRILTIQCQSDKELWTGGGRELISRVDRLLGYLFEYRHVRDSGDCAENAMSRTVQLMRYYEQFDHHNLYVVYVYKLYDLHILHNNELEAAKTLMLHANILEWEDRELPDWLVSRGLNRQCASERQLKDRLLSEAADLYAEGGMWEDAILILRELAPLYEKTYVDYEKMATLMERIAKLYRCINLECRAFFYFYLVTFYGKGFPAYLNGQRFVFRSDKLERLADFLPRMQQMYGVAASDVIASMDDDNSHRISWPGRYIQVFNVDPIAIPCPFDDSNVNPSIKEYYRHYNISDFEFSRLIEKKETKWTEIADSELMRTWIVKRRLVTYESLPAVLRCSKVISLSGPIQISPLRRSVDQMERKNRDLMETALLVLHNEKQTVTKLSGDIMGVVRANVQGGVKNYEVFFTDAISKIYESEEKQLALRLSALITEQVEILEFCLYAHATRRDVDLSFHDHLVDGFVDHKNYVEDKFGRTRSILPPGAFIRRSSVAPIDPSDKEKKSTSSSNFIDIGATPTGTLKSRGLGSTMLNMLTPARKSNSIAHPSPSPSPAQMSSSSLLDAARVFSGMRLDSRESLQSTQSPVSTGTLRGLANGTSFEGIRLRSSISRDSCAPPPLPPRSIPHRSDSPERLDRTILLGDKPGKPPVPTPMID